MVLNQRQFCPTPCSTLSPTSCYPGTFGNVWRHIWLPPLACRGQRPRVLLNIPQCTVQQPLTPRKRNQKTLLPKLSIIQIRFSLNSLGSVNTRLLRLKTLFLLIKKSLFHILFLFPYLIFKKFKSMGLSNHLFIYIPPKTIVKTSWEIQR